MPNKMLIDASHPEETRVVVVRGNRIEEFDFESQDKKQLKGNIYLARVTRVEPSLQAAFVEYGGNRHGFLAFSEIHPDYYQIPVADRQALLRAEAEAAEAEDDEDGDADERGDRDRNRRRRRGGGKHRGRDDHRSAASAAEGSEGAEGADEKAGDAGTTITSIATTARKAATPIARRLPPSMASTTATIANTRIATTGTPKPHPASTASTAASMTTRPRRRERACRRRRAHRKCRA